MTTRRLLIATDEITRMVGTAPSVPEASWGGTRPARVLHAEDDEATAESCDASEAIEDMRDSLSRLFGTSMPASSWRTAGGLHFTARWRHAGGRGPLPSVRGHLVCVAHSGSGLVIVSQRGRRTAGQIRRGAVTVLPQGTQGEVDVTGEVECSQAIVPPALFARCAREAGLPLETTLLERINVLDPVLFQLVDMLIGEADADPTAERFREQCAALICTHLVRRHSSAAAIEAAAAGTGLAAWQLRRVREYMQQNLHAPLTLHDLAARVGLSRHYLCTAFRHATGFTPHEYLTALRIDRAKELLSGSKRSVAEISACVGYGTASAFTASFRRITGITPRAFRARR